jgi:hypothetical protein
VINTKDNTCKIKSTGMEFSRGLVATSTKETISKTCAVDSAKCIGAMEVIIKASGSMGYNMVRGSFLFLNKVSKRDSLGIIHLSRFTKSSSFQSPIYEWEQFKKIYLLS